MFISVGEVTWITYGMFTTLLLFSGIIYIIFYKGVGSVVIAILLDIISVLQKVIKSAQKNVQKS